MDSKFLCRRANRYYRVAIDSYNNGYYDVSYVLCGMAIELYIKATLLRFNINYKWTHNLRILLSKLNNNEISDFVKQHRKELDLLSKVREIAGYSDIDMDSTYVDECILTLNGLLEVLKKMWKDDWCF